MGLIQELATSRELKVCHDFQRRSLLDYSGNGIGVGVGAGSAGYWTRSSNGRVGVSGTVATELTAGVQASLDLTTATLFYMITPMVPSFNPSALTISKSEGTGTLLNGYTSLVSLTAATLYLGNNSSFQTILLSGALLGRVGTPVLVAHSWNGTTVYSWVNGVLVDVRPQTKIPTSTGRTYRYGWPGSVGFHDMVVHGGGMVSRVLTGPEVARLYEDFIDSPKSADLPRRNFVQVPRGKTDAEYAAEGIVLDTAFELGMVAGARRVLDMGPNNYTGQIVGIVTPDQDGSGVTFPSAASNVYFGDVTALNATPSFTIEHEVEWPTGNIVSNFLLAKYQDANNNIEVDPFGALGTSKKVYVAVCNSGASYGISDANVFRAGCKQHYTLVYNGAGATNTDKLKLYVDGKAYPMTYTGSLPATTANLATRVLYAGFTGSVSAVVRHKTLKVRTPSVLTPTQVRANYLEFARKIVFKQTFEDVPVNLTAVGAGGHIGTWRVLGGTWKCTESTDGRRWLECITSGSVADTTPDPLSNGTKRFTFVHAGVATMRLGWMLRGLHPIGSPDPTPAQNGYSFNLNSTGGMTLWRLDSATSPAILWDVPGYLAIGPTEYTVVVSRQPSDGLISTWVSGGAYSNAVPSAPVTDPTYQPTPTYFQVQATPGDKVLMWDQRSQRGGVVHYQGQLDPTAGELT